MSNCRAELNKAIVDAIEYYKRGMFDEARATLEDLYQNNPSNPYVLSFLGIIKGIHEENYGAGIRLCREALTMEPKKGIFYYNLGKIFFKQRDYRRAFLTFNKGLRSDPNNKVIKNFLKKYERRRYKVFKNLDRDNPLNIMFGKLRARFKRFTA